MRKSSIAAWFSPGLQCGLLWLACCGMALWGQEPVPPALSGGGSSSVAAPSVAVSAAGVLRSMAKRAGVIFAGTVIAVDREDGAGFVEVRFRVDRVVRGPLQGSTYVLREWAGLWSGEPERYRTGARLLMLLTGRGRSGMSAPVDGMAGAIPVTASEQPPLLHGGETPPPDVGASTPEPSVDLRWIETLADRTGLKSSFFAENAAPLWASGGVLPLPVPEPGFQASGSAPSLTAVLMILAEGSGGAEPLRERR